MSGNIQLFEVSMGGGRMMATPSRSRVMRELNVQEMRQLRICFDGGGVVSR